MQAFWWRVRNTLRHRPRGWKQELQRLAAVGLNAELRAVVRHPDGRVLDLGVVSRRVITTVGAAYVVDAFQNLVELEAMNWHDSGTGNTAESAGDTGLVAPGGPARVAGVQSEVSSTVLRSIAVVTYTTTQTIQEHGIFSGSTGSVLLDRSVFTGIPVVNGSQIQFTWDLTVATGT